MTDAKTTNTKPAKAPRPARTKLTFRDAIATFRQSEQPEAILILLGKKDLDEQLRRVFIAWRNTAPKLTKRAGQMFEDGPDLWDRLWRAVEIDPAIVKQISGVYGDPMRYVDVLRGNRLIYPDGSVSENGRKALVGMARATLRLKATEPDRLTASR